MKRTILKNRGRAFYRALSIQVKACIPYSNNPIEFKFKGDSFTVENGLITSYIPIEDIQDPSLVHPIDNKGSIPCDGSLPCTVCNNKEEK